MTIQRVTVLVSHAYIRLLLIAQKRKLVKFVNRVIEQSEMHFIPNTCIKCKENNDGTLSEISLSQGLLITMHDLDIQVNFQSR